MANVVTAIPIFNDNYIWVILNTQLQEALVVDPGDAAPLLAYLKANQLRLAGIVITHHHPDHIGGVDEVQAAQPKPVPVYGPKTDRIPQVNQPLAHDDTLKIESFGLELRVLFTPGHTRDHLCYYEPNKQWLFCGDTLFSAGCGRLFEGTAQQMYESLATFAPLPDKTKVYCTHEYTLNNLAFAALADPNNETLQMHKDHVAALRAQEKSSLPSTLGLERQINPFLRADSPELAENLAKIRGISPKPGIETFAALRAWKDVS